MEIDPNNPVVQLCQQGMTAEFEGRIDEARRLFMQAWDARQDDYDACIAAHYVARSQERPEEVLRWNQAAVDHAARVSERDSEHDSVRGFYPSLLLNLGWSYETLGDREQALTCYQQAAQRLADLPAGPYREVVEGGIANALQRVTGGEGPKMDGAET